MASLMRVRTVTSGWTGGPGLTTHYFSGDEPPTTAQATEAVARVRAFFNQAKVNACTLWTAQVQASVDILDEATGAITGGLAATPVGVVTGTGAASYNDFASMANVTYLTGTVVNGRHLKGRTYWGPLDNNSASAGQLGSSAQSNLVTAGDLLRTTIVTAILYRVWHRPTGGAGGSSGVVTGTSVPLKLAVLRRRRD